MVARLVGSRTLQAAVAGAAALLAAVVILPDTFRSGVVAQGLLSGAGSGLLGVGLVLTYRTTRVINLSYQAMGACAAQAGALLYLHKGVPWGMAILVALVAGALTGLVTDTVLRRFEGTSRLVVTVATIGLLQVFTAVQLLLPQLLETSSLVVSFPTALSELTFVIGTNPFFGDDLLALCLVPLALGGLSWFLYRTDAGIAVRGVAENGERAQLLGVPTRRLTQIVWIVAGVLAAAVTILLAPHNGIPANPFVSTGGLFLPALAAAVVARLESLPVTFLTATGLGVVDWVVRDNVDKQALGTVVFVAVILGALLLRRRPTGRQRHDTLDLGEPTSPLPANVAALREIRILRYLVVALVVAAVVVIPYVVGPGRLHTYSAIVIYGIVALSLVVLSGWSGTVSFGQFAIVGVGAVTAGNVIDRFNLDLFAALTLAGAAGILIGLVIGGPALRVQPLYVLVTSLAFAAAMDQFFLNPVNYPDWIPGQLVRPVLWKRFPLESERAIYFVCLAVLVVVMLAVRTLARSRPGRIAVASRDNDRAAAAMAVSVTRERVAAMAIAGAIAGVAGGLAAVLENGVTASAFPVQSSVLVFSMAVVGGLGSIRGALCGVVATEALITVVEALFPQTAGLVPLATGTLLLGVLILLPGGIEVGIVRLRDAVADRIAARHGIAMEVGAAAGSLTATDDTRQDRTEVEGASTSVFGTPALSCRGVTASYGPLQVLFGVDLEVARGEIVALLGTNGAGKSTVLKAVVGLIDSDGSVSHDGEDIARSSTDVIARRGVAMMPGGRGVFPSLTVAENLRIASWQLRGDSEATTEVRDEVLDLFPILAERHDQPAAALSGGEQQQLSLAMALVTRPEILLIDELSLGLAPVVVAELCEQVRRINEAGTTIVIVEQSVNVALTLAERAVFLEKGRVRFEGATSELIGRDDILRSVFIGGDSAPAGREEFAPVDARGLALTCRGLTKRFGGITAVDDVDLDIAPGSIVGLLGHNGAGKTTLFDLLSGFQRPDTGSIRLGDTELGDFPAHRRVVAGLGRSFQEARLFPDLTVRETVLVALDRHLAASGVIGSVLAVPATVEAELAAAARADELLALLGLQGYADTLVGALSTGTRRITELACVLAVDPAVVLLDEPSAGVAQRDTEALGPLLRTVQRTTGCSIVIIEHDMALLRSLCDEFVALELGAVIARGTPDDVLADPAVVASYLGTDETAINRSGTDPSAQRREAVGVASN